MTHLDVHLSDEPPRRDGLAVALSPSHRADAPLSRPLDVRESAPTSP